MTTQNKTQEVISALCHAFEMEVEKVENYLAASVNLNGLRASSLRVILEREVEEELQHARKLADRIKSLGGTVPGSLQLKQSHHLRQSLETSTDEAVIIRGAIAAEDAAIAHYRHIIEITKGWDRPTRDLATKILADEERHRHEFEGFFWGKPTQTPSVSTPRRAASSETALVA